MAKKIWYSKPLAKEWELYQESFRNRKESLEDFLNRAKRLNSFSWQDSQLRSFIWDLWYLDAAKKLLHLYFIDKSLKDFLEITPITDLDGIIKYINENGIINQQGILELKYFPFGIHIPYENKYKAFAFGLMNNQLNQIVLSWAVENGGGWLSAENYNKLEDKNTNEAKNFRFALNTIAYMEAFPECVKEGPPDLVKQPHNENSFTLGIAEKIVEPINEFKSGRTISPHFRQGYFKRLSSDFYKNKKGQMIFVSPTMINGKAKTIEKSKNTAKLQEFSSIQ